MTLTSATTRHLEHRLARAQAEGRVPTVVAGVIRDGTLAWAEGRGLLPGGDRAGAQVQYRIGSISKTFTAALVMRLRDEGALRLDDPLDGHLTGTPLGNRTLRELLSHSAGLQAETGAPWWERTPGLGWDGLAATLSPTALRHQAGQRFHYSNLGYALLGEVVARCRRSSWADAVRRELLEPLEMTRTTTRPEEPFAPGFAVHPWADVVLAEPEHDAGALAPAGQLWSTAGDLAVFGTMLAGDGGEILSTEAVEEMRRPVLVVESPSGWSGYGLGVQAWRWRDRTLVGHAGSMPGFLAGLMIDPGCGDGVVILANATTGLEPVVATDLLGLLEDHEPRLPTEWVPAGATAEVFEILGPWYWGPSPLVIRTAADADFELTGLGAPARSSRFRGRSDGVWVGLDGYYAGEGLRVVRDESGAINHLDVASFILTRTPYDPAAPIPGGVDPRGWGHAE